jgi:undecaprenyl-diphosphatase
MLSIEDITNIFLPVLSHWTLWLVFFVVATIVLGLYAYPYFKKPRKEFHHYHLGIPIANIISLYVFTKMLEGVIYQGAILKVDAWFNETMLNLHSPLLTQIAFFITSFGTGAIIVILLIITIGILLLRKRWKFALLSLIAILGATILQFAIKEIIHRARPLNSLEVNSTFSFPSGHAITAIVYVSLLIYSYKDDIKSITMKYVLIITATTFFITVALTRVYLNVHWFSDVIAGMSLGLFWFMLVVLVERSITGLIPAIRKETKEAEVIKTKEVIKTAKKIVPSVVKK